MEVPVWGPEELQANRDLLGLSGSPTRVVKISKPKIIRKGTMVEGTHLQPQDAARQLADFLEENHLL
jgi:electron transfer flavoprotein beta subunit